jgi:hypothetical protein
MNEITHMVDTLRDVETAKVAQWTMKEPSIALILLCCTASPVESRFIHYFSCIACDCVCQHWASNLTSRCVRSVGTSKFAVCAFKPKCKSKCILLIQSILSCPLSASHRGRVSRYCLATYTNSTRQQDVIALIGRSGPRRLYVSFDTQCIKQVKSAVSSGPPRNKIRCDVEAESILALVKDMKVFSWHKHPCWLTLILVRVSEYLTRVDTDEHFNLYDIRWSVLPVVHHYIILCAMQFASFQRRIVSGIALVLCLYPSGLSADAMAFWNI